MIPRRLRNAVLGLALWLLAPWLSSVGFGSIEHVFVFLPLVAAPIALAVLGTAPVAERLQPFAAALLVVSFALAKGPIAGALVLPWLLVALIVSASTLPKVRSAKTQLRPSLVALSLFFPIGTLWLLLSRLGAGPNGLTPLTCFLAALHFHYSGFALQTILVATGRVLPTRLHRFAQIAAIAGIPLIAAGALRAIPPLKFLGVSFMVTSTLAIAALSIQVATRSSCRIQRTFLRIAASSVVAGMLLALAYGLGELLHIETISIPRMVTTHGVLNGIGFTLCALVAYGRPLKKATGARTDSRQSEAACTSALPSDAS